MTLRVIFAGTPEFASVALAQIHAAGHEVVLVLTQPDRPAGRGLKLQASSVKQLALTHGFALAQPRSLKLDGKFPDEAAAAQAVIQAANADVMVVAAYGLILPLWALQTPRLGCLNIHGSLLPRWRGAAPIHRAIEAGDLQTGITIMQMDAGLDTGDMLLVESLPIGPHDTTGALHDRLAALGASMIVQALELAQTGGLRPVKQPAEGVTYAHKVEKAEATIDWNQTAEVIVRRIHAFNPGPTASSRLGDETLKIWDAHTGVLPLGALPGSLMPGLVLSAQGASIEVGALDSVVVLTELQRPGGKRLLASDFLRGAKLSPGAQFEQNGVVGSQGIPT